MESWAEVWVGVNDREPKVDRCEPSSARVPFGTRGVTFRRSVTFPEHVVRLDVFDVSSGDRLDDYRVYWDLGPGTEDEGYESD